MPRGGGLSLLADLTQRGIVPLGITWGQALFRRSNGLVSANRCFQFAKPRSAFHPACTTKRFPSPRCASPIQIVRPLASTADTQPPDTRNLRCGFETIIRIGFVEGTSQGPGLGTSASRSLFRNSAAAAYAHFVMQIRTRPKAIGLFLRWSGALGQLLGGFAWGPH